MTDHAVKETEQTRLAWHFLLDEGCLGYPPHTKVIPHMVLTVEGQLVHCDDAYGNRANGLHYSYRPLDALYYARGSIVERVEVSAERSDRRDKGCARWRKCLWLADATSTLHEFACLCAEDAAHGVNVMEERWWRAAQSRRNELRLNSSEIARIAGPTMAWLCARDAARAGAWNGDWEAAWKAQNTRLERMLLALAPEGAMA